MELTGHGTWGEPRDPAAARALVSRARELEVDFFDTADSYGPEVSERILAEALYPYGERRGRDQGRLDPAGPSRWSRDGRPEHLRSACEGSLRRLRVDCIRLYQLHAVDPAVPLEESLGVARRAARRGEDRAHRGLQRERTELEQRPFDDADRLRAEPIQRRGSGVLTPVLELCERPAYPVHPVGAARGRGALGCPRPTSANGAPPGSDAGPGRAGVAPAHVSADAPDSRHPRDPAPRGECSFNDAAPRTGRPGRPRAAGQGEAGRAATRSARAETRPAVVGPLNARA